MQPAIYRTVIGNDFQRPDRPPQAYPVPANAAVAEVPRYIQYHAVQVEQCRQMVNAEDILKQQLLESLYEKYYKVQFQACINYSNPTLAGIIQHF